MWTLAALASEARAYAGEVWRVVEPKHGATAARLTDSLQEQAILENLLDRSEPALPPECRGLDPLLSAPFRFAPYPHGSRFRRAGQPEGAFYAAEHIQTAIAETAYYRLLFFAESPGTALPQRPAPHTAFSAVCRTGRALDLTAPPLVRDRDDWTHASAYERCQALADAAREGGLEAIRYESVRDPLHRANLAVLGPRAFAAPYPTGRQAWQIFVRQRGVQAWCESPPLALEYSASELTQAVGPSF